MLEKVNSKIEKLIEEAQERIIPEAIEEDSGREYTDGSNERNPGLTNDEKDRMAKAREDHLKDGGTIEEPPSEIDTESPSHLASILNKVTDATGE